MKFTESQLEQAFISLLEAQGYQHEEFRNSIDRMILLLSAL